MKFHKAIQTAILFMCIAPFGGAAPASAQDSMAANKPLMKGQTAPDWTLPDQNGKPVSLHDYRDKKNVVVFFFWKDDGPVCTKESCTFRDSYEKFNVENAAVIGISGDTQERHQKFKADNKLPYPLLSDPDGKVRALWGVPTEKGMPGRFTYVIDKTGVVRKIYGGLYEDKRHVVEALKALGDFNLSAF
jgi:peroxiredoxin Q/BCP